MQVCLQPTVYSLQPTSPTRPGDARRPHAARSRITSPTTLGLSNSHQIRPTKAMTAYGRRRSQSWISRERPMRVTPAMPLNRRAAISIRLDRSSLCGSRYSTWIMCDDPRIDENTIDPGDFGVNGNSCWGSAAIGEALIRFSWPASPDCGLPAAVRSSLTAFSRPIARCAAATRCCQDSRQTAASFTELCATTAGRGLQEHLCDLKPNPGMLQLADGSMCQVETPRSSTLSEPEPTRSCG